MSAKCRQIDRIPSVVRPSVLLLEVVSEISAIDLESKIGVDVASITNVVYRDGHFGGGYMGCGRCRF